MGHGKINAEEPKKFAMPIRRVRVTHISSDARREDLKDLFRKCGAIHDFWKSGSRAYIEFESSRGARKAVDRLDDHKFKGKRLYVRIDDDDSESGSSSRSRSRDKKKTKRPSGRDQCFICRDFGHWASNCPKGDGAGVKGGKCFKCGERGHIAKKCTNERGSSMYRSGSEDSRSVAEKRHKKSRKMSDSSSKSRESKPRRDVSRDRSRSRSAAHEDRSRRF